MRLVHLAHYPAPYPGSFVPMLRSALSVARARGWHVEAVLGADSRGRGWLADLERDEIPVRLLELEGRRGVQRELSSLLAESRAPTVLHTHFTAFDVPAALAAAPQRSTAVVWHLHSPARTDLAGRIRGLAKSGLVARLADRILCVSPDRAAAAVAQGAPRSRVQFFPNAIDASAFAAASEDERAAARESLGLAAGAVVLLHFGWDWHRKGGDVFLRAIRALTDRGRELTAVTIGGGGEAERLAQELGLGATVSVRPSGEHAQTLYAAADVFASPSRAEGMPFSMLEAFASGVPVAASEISGQAALGRGLGACRLTPLYPAAFADAIASLLDRDPITAASDAAEAALRVHVEYDLGSWAERLLSIYDEVLATTSSQ